MGGLYTLWGDIDKLENYLLNLNFNKYYKFQIEDIELKEIDETPFIIFYSDISKDKIEPKWLKGLMDGKYIRDEINRLTN